MFLNNIISKAENIGFFSCYILKQICWNSNNHILFWPLEEPVWY